MNRVSLTVTTIYLMAIRINAVSVWYFKMNQVPGKCNWKLVYTSSTKWRIKIMTYCLLLSWMQWQYRLPLDCMHRIRWKLNGEWEKEIIKNIQTSWLISFVQLIIFVLQFDSITLSRLWWHNVLYSSKNDRLTWKPIVLHYYKERLIIFLFNSHT